MKKYMNLIPICLLLVVGVCSFILELYILSDFYSFSLICFYFWMPISILLTVVAIIRLVVAMKCAKSEFDCKDRYVSTNSVIKKVQTFIIILVIVISLGYSAYQIHNHDNINKECYEILNISNFTDCIENENSDYNVKSSTTDSLFGATDSTVTKMVFINGEQHQIIVNGSHTKTKSTLLKNFKFHLMKMKLLKGKDYIKEENCVYFYEPGCYDGFIRYSKLIIIVKGESGCICAVVETSTPDAPLLPGKAVTYCTELVS